MAQTQQVARESGKHFAHYILAGATTFDPDPQPQKARQVEAGRVFVVNRIVCKFGLKGENDKKQSACLEKMVVSVIV